jgi:hypothetical protein
VVPESAFVYAVRPSSITARPAIMLNCTTASPALLDRCATSPVGFWIGLPKPVRAWQGAACDLPVQRV